MGAGFTCLRHDVLETCHRSPGQNLGALQICLLRLCWLLYPSAQNLGGLGLDMMCQGAGEGKPNYSGNQIQMYKGGGAAKKFVALFLDYLKMERDG